MKILEENISKEEFKDFLYTQMDINDVKLYDEINSDATLGIFQLDGNTATGLVKQIRPKNFDELNAIDAMARPGPIEMAPDYNRRKNGAYSTYPKAVQDLLKDTYSTMIFQEQIMLIFHKIGGFTLQSSNEIRSLMKALGKKDKKPEDVAKWEAMVKTFSENAKAFGISEEQTKQLTDDIVKFSGYSFCLAHSAAYTYVAAMTLYLSTYFKRFFFSTQLAYEVEKDKDLIGKINTIRSRGFDVLPPDINNSKENLYPLNENQIIFGFNDIKFVGEEPAKMIVAKQPYNSIFDFVFKTRDRKITSKVVEALISSGAFDCFEPNRNKSLFIFKTFWEEKKSIKVEEKLQALWREIEERASQKRFTLENSEKREMEKKFFGSYLFTSPFEPWHYEFFEKAKKMGQLYYCLSEVENEGKKCPLYFEKVSVVLDKNKNEMAFVDAQDVYGEKISFPIFSSFYTHLKSKVKSEEIYLVNLNERDGKLMLGKPGYTKNEHEIFNFIRELPKKS